MPLKRALVRMPFYLFRLRLSSKLLRACLSSPGATEPIVTLKGLLNVSSGLLRDAERCWEYTYVESVAFSLRSLSEQRPRENLIFILFTPSFLLNLFFSMLDSGKKFRSRTQIFNKTEFLFSFGRCAAGTKLSTFSVDNAKELTRFACWTYQIKRAKLAQFDRISFKKGLVDMTLLSDKSHLNRLFQLSLLVWKKVFDARFSHRDFFFYASKQDLICL